MAKTKPPDPKTQALRQRGSLNPHPEKVADPLFATSDFFDPRDLVQVKYEMVRKVEVDRQPISRSATAFGFSRPSFCQAAALEPGLRLIERRTGETEGPARARRPGSVGPAKAQAAAQ